jgi:hypothetical protein
VQIEEERSLTLTGIATINDDMNSVSALFHWLFGGKFLLRHYSDCKDTAMVLDNNGNILGEAHTMRSGGWSVQTKPFGGTVPDSQIILLK